MTAPTHPHSQPSPQAHPSGVSARGASPHRGFLPFLYRPEIDGLRAIAVLAVLIFHAGFGLPGGYIGVDVFFVISGYLITALMIRDLGKERFSLIDFWERRVRRIFPAAFVVISAIVVAAGAIFLSFDLESFGHSLRAQSYFATNFHFWLNGGYFSGAAQEKPLLHTWSLSVEEQFYLVFPLVLFLFYRLFKCLRNSAGLSAFIATLAVASLAWAALLVHRGEQTTAYFLLHTRAWELLAGALLAVLPVAWFPRRPALREALSAVGLGAIVVPAFLYTELTPFPGFAALPPCLGAAFIIGANSPAPDGRPSLTAVGRFLALRPLVGIGLISYSLYLWHWPLFAYGHYLFIESAWGRSGLLLLSLLLGALSWRYVETPVRKKQFLKSRTSLFLALIAASGAFYLIGFLFVKYEGIPERFTGKRAANDELIRYRRVRIEEVRRKTGGSLKAYQAALEDARNHRFNRIGITDDPSIAPTFMLWGDSHGREMAEAVDLLLKKAGVAGYSFTIGGLAPVTQVQSTRWKDNPLVSTAIVEFLESHPEITHILIVGRWSSYQAHQSKELAAGLEETLTRLSTPGRHIWVLKGLPSHSTSIPAMLVRRGSWNPKSTWTPTVEEYLQQNAVIEAASQRTGQGQVSFISTLDAFRVEGSPHLRLDRDGVALFVDSNHIAPYAALEVILPLLEKAILPHLRPAPSAEEP